MREPGGWEDEIARIVIGAAIEVHRYFGPGLREGAYEASMCVELGLRGVAFERQPRRPLLYKQVAVGQARLDLLVEGSLVVEVKSVEKLIDLHRAQVISYLRATGLHLALLINFNVPRLRDGIKRVVAS